MNNIPNSDDHDDNHDDNHDGDNDDRELTDLFERAQMPTPLPDREFLKQLREESAALYEAASKPTTDQAVTKSSNRVNLLRTLFVAATIAAVAVGIYFFTRETANPIAVDLTKILTKVSTSNTLHFDLKQDGHWSKAWIHQPGQMRVNLPDGTYRIVLGSREWHIDEKANRAASQPVQYFRHNGELDLMQLLKIPQPANLLDVLKHATVRQTQHDGRLVNLYEVNIAENIAVKDNRSEVRLECAVDIQTRDVLAIRSLAVHGQQIEPIVELKFLTVTTAINPELFVVDETLTEDGRIGKVIDLQGTVSVKPVMHSRFTPVTGSILLKPGDWLRTDIRGANAVSVQLAKQTKLTLGPGTLIEMPTPRQIKLSSGELKIVTSKKQPIELVGPAGKKIKVAGTVHYRIDSQTHQLVTLKKPPRWLTYFEGSTNQDSIGSLLAKVDGRNVPLTVGYHKVTVDIRDQIARTVIEESFVNRTNSRLEGVFYFPLPQDASISGFGMWIGNELVEADVVEKQRAREIYETILRENRDPGLLEWTGGNLFKARVFPIEANSEKRIKITYIQVLPLKNGQYRYSYSLQSEMLKLHPLRELAIDVRLSSTMPLESVTCPTHLARIDQTSHSAHVEFTALEYTPDRDFEVVVETQETQQNIVVIPQRRGADGYFMMLLTPPTSTGKWKRETLVDGDPIQMLILADTSGSMDPTARKNQTQLIASLLSSLTEKDHINLGICDVQCGWMFEKSRPATPENIAKIRQQLDQRISLGWTNLDRAFKSAAERCKPNTQLIYIGDSVVNTTAADPVAFANRLKLLFKNKKATLHAISVSSSFESVVLDAIASLGGGSMRQVSGGQTPQKIAAELMTEITQPTIRDLKVSFPGLRTARVYPSKLPNLASGKQQILLGRYLPTGNDQVGEVTVTAKLAGKPVKFSSKISLSDEVHGNSFIPRLWARKHLDALLKQGTSQTIKDEIIALSEEYHIITPYTSLLVLENDADRARFKVKRRFQMRSGEQFFAKGRERANYELRQKQIRLAGSWRVGLRRQMLRSLSGMGRDVDVFQKLTDNRTTYQPTTEDAYYWLTGYTEISYGYGGAGGGSFGSGGGGKGVIDGFDTSLSMIVQQTQSIHEPSVYSVYPVADLVKRIPPSGAKSIIIAPYDTGATTIEPPSFSEIFGKFEGGDNPYSSKQMGGESVETFIPEIPSSINTWTKNYEYNGQPQRPFVTSVIPVMESSELILTDAIGPHHRLTQGLFDDNENGLTSEDWRMGLSFSRTIGNRISSRSSLQFQHDDRWLTHLFPAMQRTPQSPQPPKVRWPADARKLAESLLRTKSLSALTSGLQIQKTAQRFDPRWDTLSGQSKSLMLVSPKSWLVRRGEGESGTTVQWCDTQNRGIVSLGFALGHVRPTKPEDLKYPPLGLNRFLSMSLEFAYSEFDVKLKPQGDNRMLMILTSPPNKVDEMRILIDTRWHVMLSVEHRQKGKTISSMKMGDFVQVGGTWWATRNEIFNKSGKRVFMTQFKFSELDKAKFANRMKKELIPRDQSQLLHTPFPKIADAKQALADGKTNFEHRIVLAIHFARTQKWQRAEEHLDAAVTLAKNKSGMKWIRYSLMVESRRHQELLTAIMTEAAAVIQQPTGKYFLATYLLEQADYIFSAGEMLTLLDLLRPIYEQQPKYLQAIKSWKQSRLDNLDTLGQDEAVFQLDRELALSYPHDYELQELYADALAERGDFPAAKAWYQQTIVPQRRWSSDEEIYLRNNFTDLLRQEGRYDELVKYLAAWVAKNPTDESPYQQYLTALIKTDQEEQANQLIVEWLNVKVHDDQTPLQPAIAAKLSAAIDQALGQGYHLHTDRIEERWLDPLSKVVEKLATHQEEDDFADIVMSDSNFEETERYQRLQQKMAARLTAEVDTLSVDHIQFMTNWIWSREPLVEKRYWRQLAKKLQARWQREKNDSVKGQLATPLIKILSYKLSADEHLIFLRLQVKEGPKSLRVSYVNQLFDAILDQPWTAKLEDEAFTLLPQISAAKKPSLQQVTQAAALHRITDSMIAARYNALVEKVEHQEKITRTEQLKKRQENLKIARRRFSKRLLREMNTADDSLRPWLSVERLHLLAVMNQDLEKVSKECWKVLGPAPPKPIHRGDDIDEIKEKTDVMKIVLRAILRDRHLMILTHLATQPDAKPKLVKRLLSYIDRGLEMADGDKEKTDKKDSYKAAAARWQMMRYRMLIALDRPQDLIKSLQKWIKPNDANNQWRRALAYLLAEQGKIKSAIAMLEKVEQADELSANDYRAMALWCLVIDASDKHERALVQAFKSSSEWRLYNWLSNQSRKSGNSKSDIPDELNKDVLRMFAALFEKSKSPQQYISTLKEFYTNTRDFRLLAVLADAVIGHTAGSVYSMLSDTQTVLNQIHDEATADMLIEQIKKVRKRANTTVDRRALDLLEMLVERRSSELLNQPEPHFQRALLLMKRAFKRDWSDGEPRLMADLLASLGKISQTALAKEQIREITVLHDRTKKGSIDRLHIVHALARLHWAYQRYNRSLDLLQSALAEYETAIGSMLSPSNNGPFQALIDNLESRGQFARGEKILLEQLQQSINRQQKLWLNRRLIKLYIKTMEEGGTVSLGSGKELYRGVIQFIDKEFNINDQSHRAEMVSKLCEIYKTAKEQADDDDAKVDPQKVADLRKFAFQRLPEILKRQTEDYQSMVDQVAYTLHYLAGPSVGLKFLIQRIENEPRWFRLDDKDGWQQHADELSEWRNEVGDKLGDLEPRLLAIVLSELKRDLQTQQSHERYMYDRGEPYDLWKEKEKDFYKVAEEVYTKQKKSATAVKHIAEYLWSGLGRYERAITILLIAHRQKILDNSGQSQLVGYLHERERFKESIPILLPLVERHPDFFEYRKLLMHAHYQVGEKEKLLTLLKLTDKYFHDKGRWQEYIIAKLAGSCLENKLFEQAIAYYEEVINLHQQNNPGRGVGRGTLSGYYSKLSQAYMGLKKTAKAVDAASGAIVSWGRQYKQRSKALDALEKVLRESPNLEAYVATLDKQAEETGMYNAIVRKAIGRVYFDKQRYKQAAIQLKLAIAVQPNDIQTHQKLIECYDRLGDRQAAIRQLLESIRLSRRNLKLYEDLAKRYDVSQKTTQAERARTSMVESLPNESEGHVMLAEIRQTQGRWNDAIIHWRQVAKIRSLEPTGLLNLAKAQIHQKQWDKAAETCRKLRSQTWPSRFDKIEQQINDLQQQITAGRKAKLSSSPAPSAKNELNSQHKLFAV